MVRVRETENHDFLQWLTAFPLSDLRLFTCRKAISLSSPFFYLWLPLPVCDRGVGGCRSFPHSQASTLPSPVM